MVVAIVIFILFFVLAFRAYKKTKKKIIPNKNYFKNQSRLVIKRYRAKGKKEENKPKIQKT